MRLDPWVVVGTYDDSKWKRPVTIAPGEGERRAQVGLVPQYKVAAEKVYALLSDGRLHAIGIADPEAQTLDDIQVISRQGSRLVLDAYQVKWSGAGQLLQDAEFRGLLAEMVVGRQAILDARAQGEEQESVARIISHLYTCRVPSTASLRGEFAGKGLSLQGFLDVVWRPAQREQVRGVDSVEEKWRPYVELLADKCGLGPDELLTLAPDLRVEVGQELAEDTIDTADWQAKDYLDDLLTIRGTIQDLVSNRRKKYVWLTAEEFVSHLGEDWKARWLPRQHHVFPTREPYEPLLETSAKLGAALDRFDQGYVVLTGSPGSGKSSLLTRLLRGDDRLAASYYAYVPDNDTRLRGEASAFLHDLFLAMSGRQGRHVPAPRGTSLDALHSAFHEELARLGEQARKSGRTEIVLIDGLDHVGRDPKPHNSLLKELPSVSQIPDGVLFVIGTRGLGDLPNHVAAAAAGGRHIEVEPLSRKAVIRLCEQAGLAEFGERIATLSAGHPLLVQIYLAAASKRNPAERGSALAALPESHGEVWDYYETVWETIAEDLEVVELLGMVSRLRGTIRLSWLIETGSGKAEIERLRQLDYLFDKSGSDRWTFFHPSFREYLRAKTAELDGAPNDALHRAYHYALAERCRGSGSAAPERFDRLLHLFESGQPQAVLREATPEFFREQVDGLRPREDVGADIRGAARALAECHDPMGVVRLALAAHELRVRGYQFPENTEFLKLLLAIGQPELAVAHLGEIDNGTSGHDRRATAMELAVAMDEASLRIDALRIFEVHEPLEWLGGRRSSLRQAPSGDRPSLWAWARAGVVLRGVEYIIESVAALRPPADQSRHERVTETDLRHLRRDLLWLAADELLSRGQTAGVDQLREALHAVGDDGSAVIALIDLYRAEVDHDPRTHGDALRRELVKIDVEALPGQGRIDLCHLYLRVGCEDTAREIFEALRKPKLPETDHFRDRESRAWSSFYSYYVLASRLGQRPDPVQAVPAADKDYLEGTVISARHVVGFAALEGRQLAGETVGAAEIVALLRRMHAFWDAPEGRMSHRHPREARSLMGLRAINMATAIGPEAVRHLFEYFNQRWNENPAHLLYDSTDLIKAFAGAGVGPMSIRTVLTELERLTGDGDSSPQDWVDLGLTWARLDDNDGAARCCYRAVGRTLTLSSEKDLQLSTWVKLLAPFLEGDQGWELAEELGTALIELDRVSYGGSPDHAARILLDQTTASDPSRGWELANRFLDDALLNAETVINAFLTAAADRPSPHWWAALSELLVVVGADVPPNLIERAATADPRLAEQWLPTVTERVAVEGRPTARRSWRKDIREAVAGATLSGVVEISESELAISDEAPSHGSSEEEPDSKATPTTVDFELRKLEERDDDYLGLEPARSLIKRIDELDEQQLARLEKCLAGTEQEAALRSAVAVYAAATGDIDAAWREGTTAIDCSRGRDWSRSWAGGPILTLIPELQKIDADILRPAVYRRLAELATGEDHFLGSVGWELDDYVEPLCLPAEETAREVLAVAAAILRDVAPLPAPASLHASDSERAEPEPTHVAEAFESLTLWLLRSPYTVAWQAGQRALLAFVVDGAGHTTLHAALESDDSTILRACAVIETAAIEGHDLAELVEPLRGLIAASSLAVRCAASACLEALGRDQPEWPATTGLPTALRLELPPHVGRRQVAGGIAISAQLFRAKIESLAEKAGIDEDALFAYVIARSRKRAGSDSVDDERLARRGSMFGWGYLKPSVAAVRAAIAEVAAELVDAGRLRPMSALRTGALWPLYDTTLLALRPARRPHEVVTFIPLDDRSDSGLYKRGAVDLAEGAESRLARRIGGWDVLGEWSEISLLDRHHHNERRISGVVMPDHKDHEGNGSALYSIVSWPASAYRHLATRSCEGLSVVFCEGAPMHSPARWLALHPGLALKLGLTPDPQDPFAWLLDEKPAVRSIWWRSGYLCWPPYSDDDEVGKGWLVVASPEILERLQGLAGAKRRWMVCTARRGDDDTPDDEAVTEGLSDLTETELGG